MAFVSGNIILQQLSGMIGQQLVFRQTARGTVVTSAPQKRSRSSPAQLAQQQRFRAATARARHLLASDPAYFATCKAAAAQRGLSALNIAVSDCMHAPEIDYTDHSLYTGKAGETIRIAAADNLEVASVEVSVTADDGQVLESGKAIPAKRMWLYHTRTHTGLLHCIIYVKATDLAGNITEVRYVKRC